METKVEKKKEEDVILYFTDVFIIVFLLTFPFLGAINGQAERAMFQGNVSSAMNLTTYTLTKVIVEKGYDFGMNHKIPVIIAYY
jgi:hypothetical protein